MISFILLFFLFPIIYTDNECPYGYKFCYHLSEDFYDFDGANGSFLLVVFRTNYVITDTGFYATWNVERIQPPIVVNTTTRGESTSPNYPNDYGTFDKQLYYIEVSEGVIINVTFDDFVTQETFDYLEIFDGDNAMISESVKRFSGDSVILWNWLSSSNAVSMKFVSDGSYQYKRWHLTWITVDRK